MNNKPQTLDPKMKAIYDQVMGTVVTAPTQPISPSSPSIATSAPTSQPQQPVKPGSPVSGRPTLISEQSFQPLGPAIPIQKGLYGSLPTTPPTVQPSATIDKVSVYSASPAINEPKKGNSPVTPILLTISGLIFFVVYAIFWVKFFNLSLPFLPI